MKPEKQLYQWDVNQYLTELQPEAQFVDYPIGNEVIRIETDGTRCRIPDEVLQTYGGKTCYVRYPDGTFRAYSFSVLYAPKPPDYIYTPEERTTFEALTARVDAAIDEIKHRADSGEFTPKKGVDYFTDADKTEMMDSVSSGAVGEFREVVNAATAEYNANASEKLTTYDTNAEQQTADYNRNAAEKLEAYNSNHAAKVAEYNQNAENKTAEFDANAAALQTEVDRLTSEIVDARYGADGVTYSSLGAAIRDQVTDLKSDLADLDVLINDRITTFNMTTGGFINKNGIQTTNQPNFSCSDYLDVNLFDKIYCVMGYGVVVLAFYDFDKKFISYLDTTGNEYTPQWWEINPPSNAVYFRFSNKHDVLPNNQIVGVKLFDKDKLNDRVNGLEEKVNDFSREMTIENDIDFSEAIIGSGVNYVGQYLQDSGLSHLDIEVKKGDKITLMCTSHTLISPISRFNGETERNTPYVIGVGSLVENTYTLVAIEDYTAVLTYYNRYPVKATISHSYSLKSVDNRISVLEDIDYSSVTSRILCVGDSLTAGDFYPDVAGTSVGDNAKSYPYFLSKKMNIQCINKGSSGATPTTWFDRLYTPDVFDDYDCMILWLGTNYGLTDTLETDVEAYDDYHDYTNNVGKYCRIIEEFKEKSGNAPIFLVKLFGCTTEQALVTSNIVIDKIALKYDLPVIDTMELRWRNFTDREYTKLGELVHTSNHLHFSTFGNMYLAHKFHSFMNNYWKNNIDKMDKPYRIRGNGLPWWMEH